MKNSALHVRTIDEGAMDEQTGMNFSEYIAILSGDTTLLEKSKLEKKISVVESLRGAHFKEITQAKWQLESLEQSATTAREIVARLTADETAYKAQLTLDKDGTKSNPVQLDGLATADPEIGRLTAIYSKEAQGFDVRIAQSAPPTLRQRFFAITAKFREVLQLHTRMLTRVKNASEGLVRAIATEVERANAPTRPYGPRPGHAPQSSGAMVFNRVV